MRSDNGGSIFAVAILVTFLLYAVVQRCADWLHLDWNAAASLLFGLGCVIATSYTMCRQEWDLIRYAPWLVCGLYLFMLPALNFWSMLGNSPFPLDSLTHNPAWYGQGWVQCITFFLLSGGAYGLNRWSEDRYH